MTGERGQKPMSSRRACGLLALPLAVVLSSPACGEGAPGLTPQELVLRRQVEELRPLVTAAENGTLLDFAQMLVVVDEDLVQQLLASVVPLEGDVGGGFHVRVDSARASFGDGLALVHLVGEARLVDHAASAPLDVYGGLDSVELDSGTGMLRARLNLFTVDLPGGDALGGAAPARRLTQALAEGGLEALLGPIEVPVRIEDRLRLPEVRTPRVRIPGMDVPVEAAVSSLRVFGGKLWVGVRARVPGASDVVARHGAAP
jgi:hypothetical protein